MRISYTFSLSLSLSLSLCKPVEAQRGEESAKLADAGEIGTWSNEITDAFLVRKEELRVSPQRRATRAMRS
jgi:hypothetical protein